MMNIEALIDTWRAPLTGMFAGWGADWVSATELAQDCLVEAYLARDRLRGDADDPSIAGPWLAGIARNLYRNWNRRQTRRREQEFEPGMELATSRSAANERIECLHRAIEQLPDDLRIITWMFYLEETKSKRIAALLGLPEKTIEGRLHRARKQLRASIGAISKPKGDEHA